MHFRHDSSSVNVRAIATLVLAAAALTGCADAPAGLDPSARGAITEASNISSRDLGSDGPGAVYALTNAGDGNSVVAFRRAEDGTLSPLGTFATGGRGSGGTIDPLASQFAVVVNDAHEALFAVNAGSDEISSFRITSRGALALVSTQSSRGKRPNSIAVHGNLLYVLNAGDNTVSGFRVTGDARLVPLPHTSRSLSSGADGAAAIRFTPDGEKLIVAERLSNRLEVFAVRPDGRLSDPILTPGNGGASFGFDITAHNQPIVSETQGSLTSYALDAGGRLTPITASISTGGRAPCWVILTADGRFAYTTNSGSDFLAGFGVDDAGHLTSLTPGVPTGRTGAGSSPIDLDRVGSRYLYTLDAGTGAIGSFVINADGTLVARPAVPAGDPASGMQGLASF
jgi:6-phosphogluconolactonase